MGVAGRWTVRGRVRAVVVHPSITYPAAAPTEKKRGTGDFRCLCLRETEHLDRASPGGRWAPPPRAKVALPLESVSRKRWRRASAFAHARSPHRPERSPHQSAPKVLAELRRTGRSSSCGGRARRRGGLAELRPSTAWANAACSSVAGTCIVRRRGCYSFGSAARVRPAETSSGPVDLEAASGVNQDGADPVDPGRGPAEGDTHARAARASSDDAVAR